jgi:23S rRNA pseudouridine1911/1915/1917 synthase
MSHGRELQPSEHQTTLAAAVRRTLPELSWSQARKLCTRGSVRIDGDVVLDAAARVTAGSRIEIDVHARPVAPSGAGRVLDRGALVHLDPDVIVVDKPAGVLSVPTAAGEKSTLVGLTQILVRKLEHRAVPAPRVVHRLDKDTSGLLVFARNRAAERALQALFRAHDIDRRYLALALGRVAAARIESDLVRDRGDGLRGSWPRSRGPAPPSAKRAITELQPIATLQVSAGQSWPGGERRSLLVTLVACRLFTGRQHQIRIHLAEAGHPIVGEPVYIRDYAGPFVNGYQPGNGRSLLHAERLGFVHPTRARALTFVRPPPPDFRRLWAVLGGGEAPWDNLTP